MNKEILIPPPDHPSVLEDSPIFCVVESIHNLSTSFSRPLGEKKREVVLASVYMHESSSPQMARAKHGTAWPD